MKMQNPFSSAVVSGVHLSCGLAYRFVSATMLSIISVGELEMDTAGPLVNGHEGGNCFRCVCVCVYDVCVSDVWCVCVN